MTVHPAQLLLDGRLHADAAPSARRRRELERRAWLAALAHGPRTVGELACAWFGAPHPGTWRRGSFPTEAITAARGRVRELRAHRLVRVEAVNARLAQCPQRGLLVAAWEGAT